MRVDAEADMVGDVPVDVVVVGAGPAGMAAAVAAAGQGARVALLDAEPGPGGQYWRHPAPAGGPGGVTAAETEPLHHGLPRYRELTGQIRASERIEHLPDHEVWAVARGADGSFVFHAVTDRDRVERTVTGTAAVLATGAHDLPLPFPGWDLPGVLTVGGAQSLLKGSGVVAGRRMVVAGTGPFLLPVAAGLARAGARVAGVFEAGSPLRWLRHPLAVLSAAGKLGEAAGYARDLARHRVPLRTGVAVVAAHGEERITAVTVAPVDRAGRVRTDRARRIATDVLAVGWGFQARLDLAVSFGCATVPDPHGLPVVAVDGQQCSSVDGLFVAGEACGIGGAELAVVEGELAGTAAALGAAAPVDRRLLRRRTALRRFAAALAAVHPVPAFWPRLLRPDTVVCRCEEVSAGRIAEAVTRDGAADVRSVKLLARPGMGWCQGRMCGYATQCLTGGRTAVTERHVATPVPLGLVARSAAGPDGQ